MTTDRPPIEGGEPLSTGNPVESTVSEGGSASLGNQPQQTPAKPPGTRTSRAFSGLVVGAVVLILLLIFILENTQSIKISFLGASGHVALGVALLLAAVGGALVTGILGAARIAQVRRHTKRLAVSSTRQGGTRARSRREPSADSS